ncbi:MAG: hypothetical protein NWR72_01425 [Bacteroidia bacterium]|nr:hypothetical protein [Bacteroidia bacterium]
MSHPQQSLKDLAEIRQIMEQSTRFLSLSGLSGVSAGIIALIGAWFTNIYLIEWELEAAFSSMMGVEVRYNHLWDLVGIALLILVAAGASASIFTIRRSKKQGVKIWNKPARRMALNLMIPLVVGAIFCVEMAWHGMALLVAPATLVFYGLALLNAGKYTLQEIRLLGISEIILGLIAGVIPGYGIEFWALGFGVLHIVYGALMYFKYER